MDDNRIGYVIFILNIKKTLLKLVIKFSGHHLIICHHRRELGTKRRTWGMLIDIAREFFEVVIVLFSNIRQLHNLIYNHSLKLLLALILRDGVALSRVVIAFPLIELTTSRLYWFGSPDSHSRNTSLLYRWDFFSSKFSMDFISRKY